MALTIIVSNRLPVSVKKVNGKLKYSPSAGGLATSMSEFTKQKNTIWLGWPGVVNEEITPKDKQRIKERFAKDKLIPIFLSRKQYEAYYNGYSNNVLWPYLHGMPALGKVSSSWWPIYKEVNELFAKKVKKYADEDSLVWVHDYQLMKLPLMLRRELPKLSIGFFLHIPFPKLEHFTTLKEAESLLRGVLGADYIGMHTKRYRNNFLNACSHFNKGIVVESQVVLANRTVRVASLPIGIDYAKYSESSKDRQVRKQVRKLRRKYSRHKVILTIDRLDPTKALPERLRAYKMFLADNPKLRKKVVLLMLAVPSRTGIPAYKELKDEVETLVADINGTYGTRRWQPVDFHYESLPFETISALYKIADVAFIAPFKDGMNLVAKEYVASNAGGNGVLILSRGAGAAEELKQAVLVDSGNIPSQAKAIKKALDMAKRESKKRLQTMQKTLLVNNVESWANTFVKGVKESSDLVKRATHYLWDDDEDQLVKDFSEAKRPLLLLDYDGVLTPFFDKPESAIPTKELLQILKKLSAKKNIKVAIISGRKKQELERWFGKLPITIATEHGARIRSNSGLWETIAENSNEWKSAVKPVLEKIAKTTPGAFVEEKPYSLVWHYRAASPYYAQKNLRVLRVALKDLIRKHKLGMYKGKKILEIKPPEINKGAAVARLLKHSHDFILAAGDDYTDEHMFAILPKNAYSIKVGRGLTQARFRVNDEEVILDLLNRLADI